MHTRIPRGYTLIEMLAVTAIIGILAAAVYPSFIGPLYKARRSDGIASLMHLQMAQEKWRSGHGRYAELADLRIPTLSSMRYYELAVTESGTDHYAIVATATGAQRGDTPCRVLRLSIVGYDTRQSSGPDAETRNADADNQRCWGA